MIEEAALDAGEGTPRGASAPASGASAGERNLVTLHGIRKAFGGVHALHGVDFAVRPGEVHAIVGENGAGKSTLTKCLAGALQPDEGEITVDGQPTRFERPSDAIDAGIRVVYQELSLFPALTVAENLFGRAALGRTWISWRRMRREAARRLREIGVRVDPRLRVEQLPVGAQQMVEIARALISGGRLIVLDEPTSALSPDEARNLFRLVRGLAARGVSFVLITHFLEEVMQHADRVTVLKDGRLVSVLPVNGTSKRDLVHLMIGRDADVLRSTYEGHEVVLPARSSTPVVLKSEALHRPPSVSDFSLELREGEVLGIYGDLASGHSDFAELLFGVYRPTSGTITIGDKEHATRTTTSARDAGVGFIPGDRRRALAPDQEIYKNVTLAYLHKTEGWILRNRRERALTERMVRELRIVNGTPTRAVGALSGGNQQKVLFARWTHRAPRILVLVEPTRGMDVGAKSEIIRIIKRLSDQGTAMLVVSTEPETILAVAERVLVARRGRIVAEFVDCVLTKDMLLAEAT